jgi:CheY-like chemotaxis protein
MSTDERSAPQCLAVAGVVSGMSSISSGAAGLVENSATVELPPREHLEARLARTRPLSGSAAASKLVSVHEDALAAAAAVGGSVLVVEDDTQVSGAMMRCLKARGLSARLVQSASSARQLAGPFVMGLMDVDLPDGDGVALAEELLARRVLGCVSFFTGCSRPERVAAAEQLGPVYRKAEGVAMVVQRAEAAVEACASEGANRRVAGAP